MGNSSSICSDKNAVTHFSENGSPIYPTATNSRNASPQKQNQQIYKTTIPINEQNSKDDAHTTADSGGNNNDIINIAHCGIPSQCCCAAKNTNKTSRHTSTTTKPNTTTTTVEYELMSNGIKLSKISTSRTVASGSVSSSSSSTADANLNLTNIPLLSSSDLNNLNFNAINIVSGQRANFSMDCSGINGYPSVLEYAPRNRMGLCGTSTESDVPGKISGLERFQNKKYNKGLAFTNEERQMLGIQGLLPARIKTEDQQLEHCMALMNRLDRDLDKYMYLNNLAERNERLFYKLLATDIGKMMPLVYTPTVGLACQNYSLIFENPKGLYISIDDKGHIYEVLRNWPETDIRAIVVTDGERILGLGDLGANGMGIPVGKLSLYTALAGIKPSQCLPITLDVGTNTQSILDDPLYIGLRHRRVTGEVYDNFIDEFMKAVVRRYGQNCLIQFEDFANANAFRLLAKYRDSYCTFNDDIQGTASVAVAGIIASLKIKNTKLKENTLLFFGAGEAALGIANLCTIAMTEEGLTPEEAKQRIWMVDSKGLIVHDRPRGGLTEHKLQFAQSHEPMEKLVDVIRTCKPTVLVGAAAIGGAFNQEILETMAEINETPIIFALSNPTSKAECTAEEAYKYTKGKCVFASGSPFAPVQYENKTFHPGQGNNSYIFPGVALGVLCAGMLTIPEEVFLISAMKLAELCSAEDLAMGSLYPPLKQITNCSIKIAVSIMEYAYKNGLATLRPEPKNKTEFVKSQMYDLSYPNAIPEVYGCNNKL